MATDPRRPAPALLHAGRMTRRRAAGLVAGIGVLFTGWASAWASDTAEDPQLSENVESTPAPLPVNLESPPSTAPGSEASDTGVNVAQVGLGAATMVATYLLAKVLWQEAGSVSVALVLAGPLFGGGVACAVGRFSDYSQGGCGLAVAGAYLGAATVIPLGLLACAGAATGDDRGCLVLIAITYFVVSPLGAMIGWNEGKQPKSNPPRTADLSPPTEPWAVLLRPRFSSASAAPVRLSIPLLAFRF
jgi:hypothetical protein